jgi:putative peptidoglycan lipid II flippase
VFPGSGLVTENTGSGVLKATTLVGASTLTVTTLGLVKNLAAAYYFGTSREMDTYALALVIPDFVQFLSVTGLFNFVPLFAAEKAEHGETEAWRVGGKLMGYWLALLLALVVIGGVLASVMAPAVAPGLDEAHRQAFVTETRVLLMMAFTVGAARVLATALIARKQFLVAMLGEVAFQAASILFLFAFSSWGIQSLVWSMVFGGLVQLVITVVGLRQASIPVQLGLDLRHPAVRKMVRLTVPVYVGNAGARVNGLVLRAFASTLATGAVAALQYAFFLVDNVAETVGYSLARAMFPYVSQQVADKEEEAAARSLKGAIVGVSLIMMPAAVGLTLLAGPVVRLVFQRGSFGPESTALTVAALRVYAPALIAIGLGHVLATVYYARQDTATPTTIGLVRVGVTVVGCIALVPRLGHVGLAAAMTAGHAVKLVMMLALLKAPEDRRALWGAARTLARVALAAAIMGVCVYVVDAIPVETLHVARLGVAVPITAGIITYALALQAVSSREYATFVGFLRHAVRLGRSGGRA